MSVLLALLAPGVWAQPRVHPGGVRNAAGLTPPGLPGSPIARGALVSIFGVELGPAQGVQGRGEPLQPELGGVSLVVIDAAGFEHRSYPIFVSRGQINALMPCSAPPGPGRVVVTVNGLRSPPSDPFQIVRRNFQLFTRNTRGYGPAVAEMVRNGEAVFTSAATPVAPGQPVALWGGGLGFCEETFDEEPLRVLIGNQPALVLGRERSAEVPGIEKISVLVPPDAPQACYVPVVVRSGAFYSNFGSLAISRNPQGCLDKLNGFSLLASKLQQGPVSWARIHLLRGAGVFERPGILTLETSSELAEAGFFRFGFESFDDGFQYPPPGTCLVTPLATGTAVSSIGRPRPLDAGRLDILGPWELSFSREADGFYRRRLSPTPFEARPSEFVLPNSQYAVIGRGGSQVGPFQASIRLPQFPEWTNREVLPFRLSRAAPIVLAWWGGDPGREFIAIRGFVFDRRTTLGRDFICTAAVEARTFTLPESLVWSLPSSPQDAFVSVGAVPLLAGPNFRAAGIDYGFFTYEIASGRNFALE